MSDQFNSKENHLGRSHSVYVFTHIRFAACLCQCNSFITVRRINEIWPTCFLEPPAIFNFEPGAFEWQPWCFFFQRDRFFSNCGNLFSNLGVVFQPCFFFHFMKSKSKKCFSNFVIHGQRWDQEDHNGRTRKHKAFNCRSERHWKL